MDKNKKLISLVDLAEGLGMDRSNLIKLTKKLEIEPKKVRGNGNQWAFAYSTSDVDTILEYREGIEHNLVRTNGNYTLKGA